ncbi:signal-induced proliferation-associated protein 1-like [Osmerus eperlanus]|uniref:signal-induced proliferation-associated protein 1-like n=1 Tax=Osmerus eperlanus TaxID=29151 RepID=UPI002E12FEDB
MSEEGFVTELQRFGYAESGGLQLGARVVRLCGQGLVHLGPDERARLLRTAHKIHITVIPPDENGKPRRSFSELYQKAIQDAERKPGEGQSGEAWVLDEREEEEEEPEEEEEEPEEEERKQGEGREAEMIEVEVDAGEAEDRSSEKVQGEEGHTSLLSPASLPLLRATSLQEAPPLQAPEDPAAQLTRSSSLERHPNCRDICDRHVYDNVGLKVDEPVYENCGELRDATPDLILAVKPKAPPLDGEQLVGAELGEDGGPSLASSQLSCLDRAERNSRALSLHYSITKILSENTDSSEEEWQSISDLASACRSILEALSREDRRAGDGTLSGADGSSLSGQTDGKIKDMKDSDSPGHLEEKVSQLEAMLKRLQDDLQKEKEDKAVLQAEVKSLRQNNQRLQEESQTTVAHLIKVTELLCNVNKPC